MHKQPPKISALLFDLDGTAFKIGLETDLTPQVILAIKEAKKRVFVSVATGRSQFYCKNILSEFAIDKPAIISGGTQIINPKTDEIVWEQPLTHHVIEQVMYLLRPFPDYKIFSNSDSIHTPIHSYKAPINVNIFYILEVTHDDVLKIQKVLNKVRGINTHILHSWTNGLWDIHITDELATKKHAMQVLLAREGLNHKNVMVVGDGNNDLPLFELAGWKVAMGNAGEKLKEAADWIAPTVDDDGLAVAIERFIL